MFWNYELGSFTLLKIHIKVVLFLDEMVHWNWNWNWNWNWLFLLFGIFNVDENVIKVWQ